MEQITIIRDEQRVTDAPIIADVLRMMGELGVYYSMFERGFLEASTDYYARQGISSSFFKVY
jgi:hypothetical protein